MKAPALSRLPLNSLRVFEAAGRLGSMVRAAEALNVQPSAVSMQLRNLADYLGVPLFSKVGRRIELTPHGHTLLQSVMSGLGQIDATIATLRNAGREKPYTLSVTPAFLHLWLQPRLPDFEAANPAFRLRIVSSRELVDLARGDADGAVRLGAGKWPGLKIRKLMDEWMVPVCTPALGKRVGYLRPAAMPAGVALLQSTIDPWSLWSPEGVTVKQPSIMIDDALSVMKAAEMGRGVALLRTSLVESMLKERRLIAIGEPIPYRFSYYWVTAKSSAQDQRHDVIHKWLKAQIKASELDPPPPAAEWFKKR